MIEINQADYQKLISAINYHDHLYYDKSQPEITDSDYDQMYFKLQSFENAHPDLIDPKSPTQKISAVQSLDKITHPYPLLSLKKANTYEEVQNYLDRFINGQAKDQYATKDFMVQLKEDGLTVALYYNYFDNQPFIAATRGAGGQKGQNITLQMQDFKGKIKDQTPYIIRGEAIIKEQVFEKLNQTGDYMNARNTVSGLLHKDEVAKGITFIAYNIENAEDLGLETEVDMLKRLKDLGFTTPQLQETFPNTDSGKKDLLAFIQNFEQEDKRSLLDHDIDGLVIKPDYLANRRVLGNTGHHPRNQLAYKFASPDAVTTLRKVDWQKGAKGRLTPVAIFDPVDLLGAKITKASLANWDNIQKRDLKINDQILIRRSNDVIPQVVKAFANKRTGQEQTIALPKNAHFQGKHLFVDTISKEQLLARWKIFISKQGLDIDHVSQKTIEDLADHDLIDLTNFASLWDLLQKQSELADLKGWSKKKIENLINQLKRPIEIPMAQFLVALALDGVGHDTATKIAVLYPDIKTILKNQPALELSAWHNQVGNISEQPLKDLTQQKQVLKGLERHVQIQMIDQQDTLTNQSFVITGAAQNHSRAELKALIEKNGGQVKNTVSQQTDFVVELTKNTISSKTQRAQLLNVPIISEDALLAKINL